MEMKHIGTIPLATDRLILRRFAAEDAEVMFKNWSADPDVTKYLMWKTHDSIEETRQVISDIWLSHYDEPNFYQWAIELKDIQEPIGSIGAVKSDDKTQMVHIGYCIGKAWWRKGYVTEALIRLVRFFFEDVGVNRIESRHDPRNPNSGKVMQKAGLRYEGTSIQSDWNNQGICDAANYALLAKDYFCKPQPSKIIEYTCRKAEQPDFDTVAAMLCELHTHYMDRDDLMEQHKTLFTDNRQVFFLAFCNGKPFAVAHGALRSEYVNGKEYDETSGYLEGIYVQPEYRMNGVAATLVRLCEQWAAEQGCREFLSDCLIDNTESYRFHMRIGFTETERCIFFRKDI
jgi:ribosomal-protein-alanine N-acetyltransferase